MKKKNLVVLALLLGTVLLFINSCSSLDDSLIIAPDPVNPFQGTWIHPSSNYMHVINGMNGEFYYSYFGWHKQAIYKIEKKDDGFITSTNWRISVTKGNNGDILTVENMSYERYVKK